MSTSPRPKSLALMFLIGAFLTGGAVGYAADRAVTRSRPPVRQFDERAGRDSLAQELGLSPAQRQVFDSVLDWRRARNKEIMQKYRPAIDSIRDSARVLMLAPLDANQKEKFWTLVRSQTDSSKTNRGGNK